MKYRQGRRLIVETISESGKDGPVAAGEFPSAFWAWFFKHFERHTPTRIAIDQTTWRGFASWDIAQRWANEETS